MSSTGPRRRTSDLFEGEHHRNLPSGVTMIGVIAELLDQLAHAPSLPGAACRGRPELFDVNATTATRSRPAKAVCATCPVLGLAAVGWPACRARRTRPVSSRAGFWARPRCRRSGCRDGRD